MKENEYLLLLYKQLSGDITPSEAAQLSDWISQSPDHARIANEYTLIWSAAGNYKKDFSPNLAVDFAKVQARIRAEEQPALTVSSFRQKLLRVAAVFALLTIAVWGYRSYGASTYFDAVASAQQVEKQLVKLSDGTQVWLREGSSLEYASSFQDKEARRVKLTGEAYFEVAHDPEHPFRVELAAGAAVEVLGTQFNVCESDKTTTVLVRSGKVKFFPNATTQSPVLTANQKAVFDLASNTLRVSNAVSLNELAWQTGGLEFVKTPLSQVILDLEKYYHVKIALRNQNLANCPHSALLTNQSLENVLDGLVVTYQLKATKLADGEYALSGGQCR